MPRRILTEAEEERAIELAEELKVKIENNFAKPPNNKVIAEARAIRGELEKMGFLVSHSIRIVDLSNPEKIEADVTLWIPKQIH